MGSSRAAIFGVLSLLLVAGWRVFKVWMVCHRAAYRWHFWKIRKWFFALLAFDIVACAVVFLPLTASGGYTATYFSPAESPVIQLIASGIVATTARRKLRLPKRLRERTAKVVGASGEGSPDIDTETVNQYIARVIEQCCYVASQLWVMEQVVPVVVGTNGTDDFLHELLSYLEGLGGAEAEKDTTWLKKLM